MTGFWITGIALVGVLGWLLLKDNHPTVALAVALSAGCVLLVSGIGMFDRLLETTRQWMTMANMDSDLFTAVIKALGICIVCGFSCDMCRDAGQSALAGQVELAGKILVLYLAFPMIKQTLSAVLGWMDL